MSKTILRYVSVLVITILTVSTISAQSGEKKHGSDVNVINTAVPFLTIAPDARGGGMGDVGVSSFADATSLYWNPAKYAFIDHRFGIQTSYVPWLRALVDDIGLFSLFGYYKIDDRSAVAASLRYFSLGEIHFWGPNQEDLGNWNPNELALDATYSRKFSDKISGAVAGRFIYSNLTQGQGGIDSHAGWSVAADVAFYYRLPVELMAADGSIFAVGVNISNIGRKISYTNNIGFESFIPTTLRFGPSYQVDVDRYNTISVFLDVSKLLVPTPPLYAYDEDGKIIYNDDGTPQIEKGKRTNVSVFQGMIQSFYDAPGGFSEEMQELMWSFGAEYWYNKMFAVRGGYFYEHKNKGNRQYLGLGASIRYSMFDLGFSYIVPTNQQVSPQDNTLRFTLSINFQ
ncbi:MAG: type IX secretion system outer membrane channel protein PorV [Bacteroidales bacterium]|nr:type IX secretion system outer membrane channel protein PorV [Bacteroidales bacterium]